MNWLVRLFGRTGLDDEAAKALIVSFLSERGRSDVSDIKWRMKDHTRGEHDWWNAGDRRLYRLLDQLEAEGAVESTVPRIGARQYWVVAAERLVAVK
jgi:DNA-binding PadR family transcriptional regulator